MSRALLGSKHFHVVCQRSTSFYYYCHLIDEKNQAETCPKVQRVTNPAHCPQIQSSPAALTWTWVCFKVGLPGAGGGGGRCEQEELGQSGRGTYSRETSLAWRTARSTRGGLRMGERREARIRMDKLGQQLHHGAEG